MGRIHSAGGAVRRIRGGGGLIVGIRGGGLVGAWWMVSTMM